MEKEKQVTPIEVSRDLFDLELRAGSLFVWVKDIGQEPSLCEIGKFPDDVVSKRFAGVLKMEYQYPAYTVAELGETKWYKDFACRSEYVNLDGEKRWLCTPLGHDAARQYGKTEAEARGKVGVYILKNKLVA